MNHPRRAFGDPMPDYRRGLVDGAWQKLWHHHADCPNYPSRDFLVSEKKPSDDDLCSRCAALSSR